MMSKIYQALPSQIAQFSSGDLTSLSCLVPTACRVHGPQITLVCGLLMIRYSVHCWCYNYTI